MAKKAKVSREYLFGTFIGLGKISINKDSNAKDVEAFLMNNKDLEDMITNVEKIKAQRALIKQC